MHTLAQAQSFRITKLIHKIMTLHSQSAIVPAIIVDAISYVYFNLDQVELLISFFYGFHFNLISNNYKTRAWGLAFTNFSYF